MNKINYVLLPGWKNKKESLNCLYKLLNKYDNVIMKFLSMGMSGDYALCMEEGSNVIRIGSTIFGARNYTV